MCPAGNTQTESTLFSLLCPQYPVIRLLPRACSFPGPVHTEVTSALAGTQSIRETDSHRGSDTSDGNLGNW